jgi:hypothetical protein
MYSDLHIYTTVGSSRPGVAVSGRELNPLDDGALSPLFGFCKV